MTVVRTVPSLRSTRRLLDLTLRTRRLQDVSLRVDFTVAGSSASAVEAAVAAVDAGVLQTTLETALASQGLAIELLGAVLVPRECLGSFTRRRNRIRVAHTPVTGLRV